MYTIQKAGIWKRISAAMLDAIMIITLAIALILFISWVTGYDKYSNNLNSLYDKYEEEYGVDFHASYDELTDEEKEKYDEAYKALSEDNEVLYTYNMIMNLTIMMVTISLFVSFLVFEFILPLIFKGGRTLGKKIFGIGVMQVNSVQINHFALFVRGILGKYTIETMVPVLLVLLIYFGSIGIVGLIVIILLLILQIVLIIVTKTNSLIHDVLASTVTIDYNSQTIFASLAEKEEIERAKAEEEAQKASYF